jgi:hypothetical protein
VPYTRWSREGWGACDAYHADIEAGRWAKMAARATLHYPPGQRSAFKRKVQDLWALFRIHRTGPAIHNYGMSDI